ncbi:uncharacterized protein DSM5745_09475 [Aspergillus mulundensis]|uniref:Uncharacterized protein n=1 Tax=Aspergillus mulundensis TaxID=1810919 RepID=A0A3D8QV65_9EURO|nr:hypothetical protein DSM5745_09475 [Aspergillus mulundensis]RDW65736.1 hypothetical protein DSM5745_09475 [Aspergillus mulundensis]
MSTHLHSAARDAVSAMGTLPGNGNMRVLIVGNLSTCHHLNRPPPNNADVDFLVDMVNFDAHARVLYPGGPAEYILQMLVMHSALFVLNPVAGPTSVTHVATGTLVQLHAAQELPYLPTAASRPSTTGARIYPSIEDCILLRFLAAPIRASPLGSRQDYYDVWALTNKRLQNPAATPLTPRQQAIARAALPPFMRYSFNSSAYWRTRIGF